MAVARSVSGSPVYLSYETKNIDTTYLTPLTYKDGHLLRLSISYNCSTYQ
ncbi:hypothetical protein [Lutibacter citreus]|nr:hypothetical protein [Lutibacter citreus]